jgi:hypothetical protein
MPELNEAAKRLVAEVTNSAPATEENNKVIPRLFPKKRKPWQKLSHWAAAIFLLPFLLTSGFIFSIYKAEGYFGSGGLDWLWPLKENHPTEFEAIVTNANMEWLPLYLNLYHYKELIIGGTFALTILIVVGLLLLDIKNENKEANDE